MNTKDWPTVFNEDATIEHYFLFDQWMDKIESGNYTIEDIQKETYLPAESIIHAISCNYFLKGEIEKAKEIVEERLKKHPDSKLHIQLLRCLMAMPEATDEDYYNSAKKWADLYGDTSKSYKNSDFENTDPDKKLTLGFFCSYAKSPLVLFGIRPLLSLIDRNKFRVVFFSIGYPAQRLYKSHVDKHIDMLTTDADAICRAIRDEKVDILLDLNGHLRLDNPTGVFVKRPAPVQVSWWNTIGSYCLDTVQYLFGCEDTNFDDKNKYYYEKIYKFKNAHVCLTLPEDEPVSPLPCLKSGVFTFGSFNGLFKTNDLVLNTWAKILKAVPNSRLVIKAEEISAPRVQKRIFDVFQKHGIQQNRILYDDATPYMNMLQKYSHIDLGLNTFEYSGGTTSVNGLWQGVPYITKYGQTMQGNLGLVMLKSVGLDEFIGKDLEDYIAKAVYYANNPHRLAEIRGNIRSRLKKSSLFNPALFAKELEEACRLVWQDWVKNEVLEKEVVK